MSWEAQQAASIARYQHDDYEADSTLGELFGGFIATTIDKSRLTADIGCGLHPHLPHYVKNLGLSHFVGVEPLTTPVERTFNCHTGVIAEDLPFADNTLGSAIFATSLDHIEDADAAMTELRRVLARDGRVYFWLGVHDPQLLAEQKTFGNIHNRAFGWRKWARIFGAPVEHLMLWRAMRRRTHDLAHDVPLDSAHVRYHTLATVHAELASYGLTICRQILVPGSASLFVEARFADA